jgi:hypothetical protein
VILLQMSSISHINKWMLNSVPLSSAAAQLDYCTDRFAPAQSENNIFALVRTGSDKS